MGPLSAKLRVSRTLVSKTSGILADAWVETYRLPPIRVVLWEETGLQNRSARFESLTARQVLQVWVSGIPAALCSQSTQVRFLPPDPLHEPWVVGIPVGL